MRVRQRGALRLLRAWTMNDPIFQADHLSLAPSIPNDVSCTSGAIAPDEEGSFAKRMKATTTELNTSHVPMLSKPKDVAAVIMDAAAKAPH